MKSIKNYLPWLLIFIIALSISGYSAFAADEGDVPPPNSGLINPLCPSDQPNCSRSDAAGLLKSIVDWLIKPGGIATTIAVGMILVGSFQIMFAGGDEERFKRGKKTILYTAIGYAIILVGWGLTSIIQDFLSH